MAIIKISELPVADSPLSPSDVAPFLQNGVTKKASIDQFGFLPAGANAVTRTIQTKLRETVSVKDFGAVGDGVTDDTAAIQAAFFAGTTRSVFFPAGDYIVNSKLFLPAQTKIYGEVTGIGTNENRGATIRAGSGLSDYIIENYSLTAAPSDPWAHGVVIEGIKFQNNAAKTANGINFGPAGDCSKLSRIKLTGFPIGLRTSGSGLPATSAEVAFSADTISLYACEIGILFDSVSNMANINNLMVDGNTTAAVKFNGCGFTFHCNITNIHAENIQSDKLFWMYDCSNACVELTSVDIEFGGSVATTTVVQIDQPTGGLAKSRLIIRDIACANSASGKNILVDNKDSITITSASDLGWAEYHHNTNAYFSGVGKVRGVTNDAAASWAGTLEVADATSGGNVATGTVYAAWYKTIAGTTTVMLDFRSINLTGLTAGNTLYVRGLPVLNNGNFAAIGIARYSTMASGVISQCYLTTNQNYVSLTKTDNSIAKVSDLTTGGNLWMSITYFNSLGA